MNRLTNKELKEFFIEKQKLIESQEVSKGLCEYLTQLSENGGDSETITSLNGDIQKLQKKIDLIKKELGAKADAVKYTLGFVDDDTARSALMLHYYEGLAWEIVAAILKSKEECIKSLSYRHLKNSRKKDV